MGIRLVNYCEAATITRCTIEDNTNSGLEANQYATVTIDDSVFSGNSDGYGGAVYMNTGASVTIALACGEKGVPSRMPMRPLGEK